MSAIAIQKDWHIRRITLNRPHVMNAINDDMPRASRVVQRRRCGSTGWAFEKAKRMMLTGDKITEREAADMGLVLKAVPANQQDAEVGTLATRMATVPTNPLTVNKMVINQTIEATIHQTRRLTTVFDGITRHFPEGLNFKARAETVGWKQAVRARQRAI